MADASFLIAQDHNNSLNNNVAVAVVEEAGADEANNKDPALKSNVASDEDPALKSCAAIVEEAVVDEADKDYPPFIRSYIQSWKQTVGAMSKSKRQCMA